MTITNNMGLPEALVKACDTSPHNSEGNVSATTLLQGIRQIILTERHWHEMTEDVSNRIWALFGTAIHKLLETESPDTFTEEFFSVPVGEYKVTGTVDCYDMTNGIIHDYKSTSVWKIIKGDFVDWRKQGLIYAWLLTKQGFPVKECRFTAILKDHSKSKAKFDKSYPQTPVWVYQFTVSDKDLEEIEKEIIDKVEQLAKAKELPNDKLPMCTEQERWAEEDKIAVMKKGRKTAIRVFSAKDRNNAEQLLEALGKDHYLEERKGVSKKCQEYCACCEWCNFWREHCQDNITD